MPTDLLLVLIEANQQILHQKQINTKTNIPVFANILFISLQSENFEANEVKIFKKMNIN